MKYQLVIDTRKIKDKENRFKVIKFDTDEFYSLEDIDLFTTEFLDQNELKDYLKAGNLIDKADIDGQIRIIDEEKNIVTNGVAYKSDKKYFDISYIRAYFMNYSQDQNVMNKLYYSFSKSVGNRGILYSLSCDIRFYLNNPQLAFFENINININNVICDFINKLCGSKYGYKNTHKLGMIISKLENKNKKKEDIKYSDLEEQRKEEKLARLRFIENELNDISTSEDLEYLLEEARELRIELGLEYENETSTEAKHTR